MNLIKLPEGYIVTSNEIAGYTYNKPTWNSDNRIGLSENNQSKKIIASTFHPELLPQIEFDLLSDEDAKEIDYIDIKKLALKVHQYDGKDWKNIFWFEKGFQKAQSLSDKMFSLEDMKTVMHNSIIFSEKNNHLPLGEYALANKEWWNNYINSLSQPKQYNIEVEMECGNNMPKNEGHEKVCTHKIPKITNGKIKITKIL